MLHAIDLTANANGDYNVAVLIDADGTAILVDTNAVDAHDFIDCNTHIMQTMTISASATIHTPEVKE